MKAEASFTEGIYTVDLFRDDDCSNPREDDGHFLWLGFPHRRYDIGDEQIDPSTFSEDFLRNGATDIKPNERPPFGCCLLIWKQQEEEA